MKRVRLIQTGISVLSLAVLIYFGSRWFTTSKPVPSMVEMKEDTLHRTPKQVHDQKKHPFQGQDPWSVYHNEIVELTIESFRKAGARMTLEDVESIRAQLAAQHEALRAAGEEVPEVPKSLEVTTKISNSGGKLHDGPQTVEAIMETFDAMHSEHFPLVEMDMKYPRAQWIQRCLERGALFQDYGDYSGFLSARHAVIDYENDPNSDLNMDMKEYYGLPPDASLAEYMNAVVDGAHRDLVAMREAAQEDPTVSGGFGTRNGFIPMREGVLHVKVDEEGFGAKFYGDPISEEEEYALLFHGRTPEGLDVVYLGEDDKPLPPNVKPRLDWANYDLSDDVWAAMEQNMSDQDWEAMGIERDRMLEIRDAQKEAQATAKPVEQAQAEALKNVIQNDPEMAANFEKQLTPELPTSESIETELSERLSLERFDKAQQLIDQFGTEEGFRRLREIDPEAARQFERERRKSPVPSESSEESSTR